MRERNTVTAIFEDALSAGAAWDVLHKLTHAFQWVADDAMNIANGGRAKLDLTPDGELARLERRAGEYDKADPFFPKGVSNPCKSLAKMRELLTLLDAAAAEGEREGYPDEAKEALRVEALRVVANSSLLRDMARIRGEAIFEREGLAMAAVGELARAAERVAEAEAREQEAKAEMYKAQGRADAEAEARKRAEDKWKDAEAAREVAEVAAAEAKAKAEVYEQMMKGEFDEIKSGVQEAAEEAGAAKHAAARAGAEAARGRVAAEGANKAAAETRDAVREDGARTREKMEAEAKKLAGRQRGLASLGQILEALQALDEALKDEGGGKNKIADGVCDDFAAEGRPLGFHGKRLKNLHDEWVALGKPPTPKLYMARLDAKRKGAKKRRRRAGTP